MLKDIYRKYKIIIWPLFSGIASVVVLALVVIPQFTNYLNTRTQITDLLNKTTTLEAKADELSKIDSTRVSKDLEVVFSVLPTEEDIPQSADILEDLVQKYGLERKNITYSSSSKRDGVQDEANLLARNKTHFNIVVAGSLENIRNFMLNLQNSPRVFQVESMSVRFQRGSSQVDVELPVSVFYESVSGSVDVSSQDIPKLTAEEEQLLSKLSKAASSLSQIPRSGSTATSGGTIAIPGSGSGVDLEVDTSSVPLGKADPFE